MNTLLATTTALILSAGMAFAANQGGMGVHFIENWDLNEDGKVTLEEATEKRGDLFAMFDQDENDVLDSAEYDMFDETRKAQQDENGGGMGRGRNNPIKGMVRQVTDVNGDGNVTRDEFMTTMTAWYTRRDKNGDGVITTDDFGRRRN